MLNKEKIESVCNRHAARLMTNLEDAECAKVYVDAVRREFRWLRGDLCELVEVDGCGGDDRGNV